MNVLIKEDGSNQDQKLYYSFDGKEWVEKWELIDVGSRLIVADHIQKLEPVRNQVLAGLVSPLDYYIQLKIFTISLLSSYTGIPKRHIKKHLKPENFNQLDDATLKIYADVFRISIDELNKTRI